MLTNWETVSKSIKRLKEVEGKFETGEINNLTKKEKLNIERTKEKLELNLGGIKNMPNLKIIVVDSIQTMFISEINGFPGTISQVRASANELIISAKNSNVALIFVGHVTKDGAIAGPRAVSYTHLTLPTMELV